MDGPAISQSIPFTAWEQAVFVALFVLIVVIVLGFTSHQSDKQQKWFSQQQDKWQSFIDSRDVVWLNWLDANERRSSENWKSVTDTLRSLALKIDDHDKNILSKLETHDNHVDERIEKARTRATPRKRE